METSIDDFELQYKRAFHHFNRMGPKVISYTFLKKKFVKKIVIYFIIRCLQYKLTLALVSIIISLAVVLYRVDGPHKEVFIKLFLKYYYIICKL